MVEERKKPRRRQRKRPIIDWVTIIDENGLRSLGMVMITEYVVIHILAIRGCRCIVVSVNNTITI